MLSLFLVVFFMLLSVWWISVDLLFVSYYLMYSSFFYGFLTSLFFLCIFAARWLFGFMFVWLRSAMFSLFFLNIVLMYDFHFVVCLLFVIGWGLFLAA